MTDGIFGRVSSIQSLGTLDGPGVRFVVFMQGCNLRCGCCHNPETHSLLGGERFTAGELYRMALRYRDYFGREGGITLSGGEPLLQADFASELFSLCHEGGINTCLDTSGSILNDSVKELISKTDRVLLDIKYTSDSLYRRYVGCGMDTVLSFLSYLNDKNIKTTVRQVIIPTLNDNEKNILRLKKIIKEHKCVDKTELLPFKKICQSKYDSLRAKFPFESLPTPTSERVAELDAILND